MDIRCIDGSPTHTRYTCYELSLEPEVGQGPVTSLPSHSPRPPQVTIKWLSPANRLPCSPFFRGLAEGSPSVIALVSYLAAPADRVTPRRFRATSRTGDVVVSLGCGGNGCVNTRLVTRAYASRCFVLSFFFNRFFKPVLFNEKSQREYFRFPSNFNSIYSDIFDIITRARHLTSCRLS